MSANNELDIISRIVGCSWPGRADIPDLERDLKTAVKHIAIIVICLLRSIGPG